MVVVFITEKSLAPLVRILFTACDHIFWLLFKKIFSKKHHFSVKKPLCRETFLKIKKFVQFSQALFFGDSVYDP